MTPGILPNGLFWTQQLPSHTFDVYNNGRIATLSLRNHALTETFQFGGPLAIAASVNIDILWKATGDRVKRGKGSEVAPTDPAAFKGNFAEARCEGRASGIETGFSFVTGDLNAKDFFAEMGEERNGRFL